MNNMSLINKTIDKNKLNDLKNQVNKLLDYNFDKIYLHDNYFIFTVVGIYYFSSTFDILDKISKIFKTNDIRFIFDIDASYPNNIYTIVTLKIKNVILDE